MEEYACLQPIEKQSWTMYFEFNEFLSSNSLWYLWIEHHCFCKCMTYKKYIGQAQIHVHMYLRHVKIYILQSLPCMSISWMSSWWRCWHWRCNSLGSLHRSCWWYIWGLNTCSWANNVGSWISSRDILWKRRGWCFSHSRPWLSFIEWTFLNSTFAGRWGGSSSIVFLESIDIVPLFLWKPNLFYKRCRPKKALPFSGCLSRVSGTVVQWTPHYNKILQILNSAFTQPGELSHTV